MKTENEDRANLVIRTAVILTMIAFAAALRIVPHPWNFAPVGAMALFSGAMVKDRRWAFLFPLLALFAGDIFVGFHKLMPLVYASILINVALGLWLRDRRSVLRLGGVTLVGAVQFFLVTNFGVWAFLNGFSHTYAGLIACYVAGIPLFWNTLAGDVIYSALLFGGLAFAEHFVPILREPSLAQGTD